MFKKESEFERESKEVEAPWGQGESRWAEATYPTAHIGRLHSLDVSGAPWVDVSGAGIESPTASVSSVPLSAQDVGRKVVLLFEGGDRNRPIIVGLIQAQAEVPLQDETRDGKALVKIDGQKLLLQAEREIVLQCGQSSLTLSRDGKIVIRGVNLLSRASGVNKIKGGTVHLN
jgi:hypothetical protein